jgi:hypothetical protein
MTVNFESWKARAKAAPIVRALDGRGLKLKRVGAELVGPCPKCGGTDRFSVHSGKGVFNCRGCEASGDVIALVQFLEGCDFITAVKIITGEDPPKEKTTNGHAANGKDHHADVRKVKAAEHPYHDRDGAVVFAVERIEYQKPDGSFVLKHDGKKDKIFSQKRPDPNRPGRWIHSIKDENGEVVVPIVPYRLPGLIEAVANDQRILIVEGELKADLLWSWNVVATCNVGGSGKWRAEHSEFLRGADVILCPDADDVGWKHINAVGASLVGIARSIRVLVLPHVRPKDDVVDWARRGGTREQLDELIAAAEEWKPDKSGAAADDEKKKAAEASEAELIARLAEMPDGIPKARERKRLASQFKVSPQDIDAEVKAYNEDKAAAPLFGHWTVEPWPDPVDGDGLLRDLIRRIQRHVVIDHHGALVIALWLIMSWVHDAVAVYSPILNINSSEPESGKSTTMGLVSFLMPRCIASVEVSEAAIYRAIKRWEPSFCFDEFDSVLADDSKAALRSVINSGHTRGSGVLRCIGEDRVPELFFTFAPKAIAMNGRKLPPPTLSRCIFVELRRRTKSESITEPFQHQDDAGLAELRRRLRRWAMDNEEALLPGVVPAMPEELLNRRGNNWSLMLRIADLCDGIEGYGEQARFAAVRIEGAADSRTITVKLLADCKAIREAEPFSSVISSASLIAKLTADESGIWAEFKRGKPLTQAALARMLGKFQILARNVRPEDGPQAKGYHWHDFEEAWARYC